ncbi:dihydromonapterin reductase [Marinobacterium aestuarii]|uniref:Dihydromonapterin reductase n=1 Tax=Marinobacterium aestuarii TaxID=1821621 RepID=A0A1A9F294_9GAMM|nr:dihydromonapterin reductase [Marinobacterium aestuarii]ANG64434.1 dihydromonapterin reductase [Marinobacterium aestuarii]
MIDEPRVLITGGGQRIGLHCARRLVADGYRVIITCTHLRPEWKTGSLAGIEVLQADFSTLEGIQGLIDTLRERKVHLRAIIHNASLWLNDRSADDAFQKMFMVHMQAPYMINQQCADLFDSGMPADIIHISDYVAQRGSAKHLAYCATKAGLESLAQSFAAKLSPHIKVNTIAPSMIMFNEDDPQAYRTKTLAKSAMGIEPGPEVVYEAVRYLMNSTYATGTCMELNGGRDLRRS